MSDPTKQDDPVAILALLPDDVRATIRRGLEVHEHHLSESCAIARQVLAWLAQIPAKEDDE